MQAQIKPLPSGIAAYCDPSLCRDLWRVNVSRIITGDAHVQPNREIRVGNLCQRSCRRPPATKHRTARAADDCLSGPKGATPEGSHWYYRVDHATKRHCWYLRAEGEKAFAGRGARILAIGKAGRAEGGKASRNVRSRTLAPNADRRRCGRPGSAAPRNAAPPAAGRMRPAPANAASTHRMRAHHRWSRRAGPSGSSATPHPAARPQPIRTMPRAVRPAAAAPPPPLRGPARRGGLRRPEPVRFDPDAADRRDWRTVACRPHRQRGFQVRRPPAPQGEVDRAIATRSGSDRDRRCHRAVRIDCRMATDAAPHRAGIATADA